MMLFWMLFVLFPAAMGQSKSELCDCYNRTNYTLNNCNDSVVQLYPEANSNITTLKLLNVTFSNDAVIRITDPVEDNECEGGEQQPCVFNAFDDGQAYNTTDRQRSNKTLSFICQPDVECIFSEGTAILLYEQLGCNDTLPSQVIVIVRPGDSDDTSDDTSGDCTGGSESSVSYVILVMWVLYSVARTSVYTHLIT